MHPEASKAILDARRDLSPTKIPTAQIPDENDRYAIQLAISALTALLVCGLQRKLPEGGPELEGLWTDIHTWVMFLDSRCGTEGIYMQKLRILAAPGEDLQAASLRVIPLLITTLCTSGHLRSTIVATPGILSMCARRWAKDGTGSGRHQDWSAALGEMVFTDDYDICKDAIDEMVEVAGEEPSRTAKVVLAHLRSFFDKKPPNYEDMVPHFRLIYAFSSSGSENRPLLLSMLHHKLLASLIEALNLSNNDALSGESYQRDQYIMVCYSTITVAIQSSNGAVWIAQALDGGLLPAVLKSGARLRRLPDSAQDMVRRTLFRTMHQYLPYRSLLRSVAKALRNVDQLKISAESMGPLSDPWTQFHNAAMGKLILKDAFDRSYPSKISAAMIGCMNKKCRNRSDTQELMRCSSCLFAVYCTKECQREDWPDHQTHCKDAQQRLHDGVSMPMHLHDRNFISYQTSYDFYRHDVLIKDVKAHWPAPGHQPLCLEVDYYEVPPKLFVQPVYDFDWKPGYEVAETERYLKKAREAYEESGQRSLLLCVIVRDGGVKLKYLKLFDIDLKRERSIEARMEEMSMEDGESAI